MKASDIMKVAFLIRKREVLLRDAGFFYTLSTIRRRIAEDPSYQSATEQVELEVRVTGPGAGDARPIKELSVKLPIDSAGAEHIMLATITSLRNQADEIASELITLGVDVNTDSATLGCWPIAPIAR